MSCDPALLNTSDGSLLAMGIVSTSWDIALLEIPGLIACKLDLRHKATSRPASNFFKGLPDLPKPLNSGIYLNS